MTLYMTRQIDERRLSRRALVRGTILAPLLVSGCGFSRTPFQTPKAARIGFLASMTQRPRYEAFREGIRDTGYTEGRDIVFEPRWAERDEQFPDLAAELAQLGVNVIVAGNSSAALASKRATDAIPIVFISNDPVEAGLVTNLARPGANITGMSLVNTQLAGKRLQLLKDILATVTRIAVLVYPSWATAERDWKDTQAAAQALDLKLQRLDVQHQIEFAGAFATAHSDGVEALLVLPCPFFVGERVSLVELAAQYRLPALYESREFVEDGGLLAYGADASPLFRRAATYVDKILKGANPGELPVEQPTVFDFVVNVRAAQALGVSISPNLAAQVTEWVQ
jgi:putative tryptophan/tyrosine transport system substrate-binding protein